MGGALTVLRMSGDQPYVTDNGNLILDCHLKRIGDAEDVSVSLNQIPGVVETGLFLDIADTVIVGHEDGTTDMLSLSEDEGAEAG